MSGPYGVTPAGFVLKPLQVLIAEYNADVLGTIDPDVDLSPDQPLGQFIGIGMAKLAEGWELAQVGFNANNRGDAEGPLLDNIGALTGTLREKESPSSVPCTCRFTAAGTYVAGALVAFIAATPTARFANADTIVVPVVGGDGSTAIGASNPWPATTDPPTTFLFKSLSDGPAAGAALVGANELLTHSGSLSQKVPVSGWLSVADVGAVTLGAFVEEDPPYRVRQVDDLAAPGNNTIDATRAAILLALQRIGIDGASVRMYENTKRFNDLATGLPGKSYMAVVYDGAAPNTVVNDPAIAAAIWANKPGGMESYGSSSAPTLDRNGVSRTVFWTRPTKVDVYLELTVSVAPGLASDVKDAIKAAVALAITFASQGKPFTLYGATFTPRAGAQTTLVPSQDVVAMQFRAIAQGQAGVLDVPTFTLGTAPSPVGTTNIPIPIGFVGVLHTVTVHTADFAP